ncbi:UNVERIFIED_CONTAM: hypothetical protein K2H54_054912 [Gekko kuhli]
MGRARAACCLLLLAAVASGRCGARFVFPLQVSPAVYPNGSLVPTPVLLKPASRAGASQEAGSLALAAESGGAVNFVAMVDNLQGDSGRGYYLEMLLGTPPQKVGAAPSRGSWEKGRERASALEREALYPAAEEYQGNRRVGFFISCCSRERRSECSPAKYNPGRGRALLG